MTHSKYLNIIDPSSECINFPNKEDLAIQFPYELDPFQKHAVAAIRRNENVLITASTSAGKSTPAVYQIAHSLAKGRRVFYTTPIKSLSNQKFHDLKMLYPGRVGLITGDAKFMPDAEVVIMTTEILRNLLYKKGSATEHIGLTAGMSLDGLDAVVFDEVHYINNKERGKVWEETLILLPPEINLVMLSATIAEPAVFASWLGDLKKKPIHLISTTYRIVPLTHYVLSDEKLVAVFGKGEGSNEYFNEQAYKSWLTGRDKLEDAHKDHKKRVAGREAGQVIRDGKVKIKSFTAQMNACIRLLLKSELLPALFFVFSRNDCERYASQIEGSLIDASDGSNVEHIFDFHLSRYKNQLMSSPQYHVLRDLLMRGIAYHHSGLQPLLKEIIEILFGKGLIRVMFCTETFAVGINMPTKTVVFLEYTKYCDEANGRRMLATDEYIQMAGRAGRRGKDKLGTVLYLPRGEPSSLEQVRKMMTGGSARISSRMDFGYDFLLKTLQSGTVNWKEVLLESYWYKQQDEFRKAVEVEYAELKTQFESLGLTEADMDSIDAHIEKKKLLEFATKDYRKQIQTEVGEWERVNVDLKKILEIYPMLRTKLGALEQELEEYGYEELIVAPYLKFLEDTGFIEGLVLTKKGICATEVNEAQPILLTLSYEALAPLSAEEIIGFLSAFVDSKDEDSPSIGTLRISEPLRDALKDLRSLTERMWAHEKACGISFSSYWDLSTGWIEVGGAWMKGSSVGEICSEFGVFEGNLYKYIMSVSNMIDELISVATLCSDVTMLEKLESVKNVLVVGSFGESLYLRL